MVQECIGSSSEEEDVTLNSSVAGPSSPSRTVCSRSNPILYDWKEISNSKERGTTALMCFLWLYFVHRSVVASMQIEMKSTRVQTLGRIWRTYWNI